VEAEQLLLLVLIKLVEAVAILDYFYHLLLNQTL
jgi:hypothetical protein